MFDFILRKTLFVSLFLIWNDKSKKSMSRKSGKNYGKLGKCERVKFSLEELSYFYIFLQFPLLFVNFFIFENFYYY